MRRKRAFVLALAGAAAVASWSGCGGGGGDDSTAPGPSLPASVVVTPTSASLLIGQTEQLRAEVRDARGTPIASLPTGTSIAWSSSDTAIVVVSPSGQARAVRDGTATLRAVVGQIQGSAALTVTAPRAQLEVGARASGRVGPGGGTITATAGGKRYELTIPAGALRDTTEISVTPITSMENLPVGATLVAGVDFAPSGLRLAVPATLRIAGVGGNRRDLVGFDYQAAGSAFRRSPRSVRADTVLLLVTHFSGAGAVTAVDAATIPWPGATEASIEAYYKVDALSEAGDQTGTYDGQAFAEALMSWYSTAVRPLLQSANTDEGLVAGVSAYGLWKMVVECGGDSCPSGAIYQWPGAIHLEILTVLSGTLVQAKSDLAAALKRGIDRSNEQCRRNSDFQAAKNVWFWQRLAAEHNVATPGSGLDAGAVLAGFCLKVVFQEASFPSSPEGGTPATLRVKAGLSYGGAAPIYTPPVFLTVNATGVTPPGFEFTETGADGSALLSFTPTGDEDVVLNVRASPPLLESVGVLRDTVVRREPSGITVSIEPVAALLDPGTQAQFTATVRGTSNQAVTWSETGGTISETGLYTAGSVPGTYSVTAKSVANNTKTATARVEILGERVVYAESFASGLPGSEWSNPNVTTSPNGERFSGPFQSTDVRLSLGSLPAHTKLTVEFDVYAIDTWDGNHPEFGPDVFQASIVGGPVLKRTTFTNIKDDEYRQAYPGDFPGGSNPAGTGASLNSLGYPPDNNNADRYLGDAAYRMRFTIDHTSGSVTISFAGIGLGASPADERWGIDNVRVIVAP